MTIIQITLLIFAVLLVIALLRMLYRRLYLKEFKVINRCNKWEIVLFFINLIIISAFVFRGEYDFSVQQNKREKYNVPLVDSMMSLSSRSRFEEEWISSDTSNVSHKCKIVKLGIDVDKEIDYYVNRREIRTLIIENIYNLFSEGTETKYIYVYDIVYSDNFFDPHREEIELTKEQKDSIVKCWNIKL
jgi:hypothetical protein